VSDPCAAPGQKTKVDRCDLHDPLFRVDPAKESTSIIRAISVANSLAIRADRGQE